MSDTKPVSAHTPNWDAILSVILGFFSLTGLCYSLFGIIGIPAIWLGVRTVRGQSTGGELFMAIVGILTGLVGLVWLLFYLVLNLIIGAKIIAT